MSETVRSVLRRLRRVEGVRAVMVVDASAGVPVASELVPGVGETALAALADSVFRRTEDASRSAGFGQVRVLQLEASDGHLVVAGAGPLLVVVLTEAAAQLGLVRVQSERAAKELGT